MAIIIPPKHIYDVDNYKILKNQIGGISTNLNSIIIKIIEDGFINQQSLTSSSVVEDNIFSNYVTEYSPKTVQSLENINFYGIGSTVEYNSPNYIQLKVLIPYNANIINIKRIQVQLFGDINKGQVYGNRLYTYSARSYNKQYQINFNSTDQIFWEYKFNNTIHNQGYTIPLNLKHKASFNDLVVVAEKDFEPDDNLKDFSYRLVQENDTIYLEIDLRICVGIRTIQAQSKNISSIEYPELLEISTTKNKEIDIDFIGNYIEYVFDNIVITCYGENQSIQTSMKSVLIDEKPIYTLLANELFQEENEVHIRNNANKIIKTWQNGKETAVITCGIADYYDEDGNKVIDTNTEHMSFLLHEQVIPYIYTPEGTNVPMSLKKNGEPKVFEVVQTKITYDGVPLQEITLLEVTENT